MADGTVRELRHTAAGAAGQVPALLKGKPGLKKSEQKAALKQARNLLRDALQAVEDAREVVKSR